IPDFPVQLIAVRTDRNNPPGKWHSGYEVPDVVPNQLPEGEGDFVNADPTVVQQERDGRMQTKAISFREVDFPFKKVKPQILKGMEIAMKRKLFDEIGVLPATSRCGDPVLVGRIKRQESGYSEPTMTFLIAWWIDTRDL
ncbi:hypothetical protein LCGC14_2898870, partial [marine sediment metagenome]